MSRARHLLEKLYEKKSVKIPVVNVGILEVPEGQNFWDLPISHYVDLVNKNSYEAIARALTNLEVWNKDKNPEITQKAKDIHNALKKEMGMEVD